MDKVDILQFIPEYLFVLVVAAYILGLILKSLDNSIIKDKYIPVILGIFCITIAVLLNIINAQYKTMLDAIVNGVLHGILAWGVSIGVSQLYIQTYKREE